MPEVLNPQAVVTVNINDESRYDKPGILSDIHFSVRRGECLAVIGPNGCGKSTLLRAVSGEIRTKCSDICLWGTPSARFSRQLLAKKLAVMAQHEQPDSRLTVSEYVALGRIPHYHDVPRHQHQQVIRQALAETDLDSQAHRLMNTLSGGERQRASLARIFAQSPEIILLDEPTNHLDPRHRVELLQTVKNKGFTVIAVLHDLALIDAFADRVLVLQSGRQIACDTPDQVLTSAHLLPVFGLNSFSVTHPQTQQPVRLFDIPRCA